MSQVNGQSPDVYEGNAPYLFISYSHKDQQAMLSVRRILEEQNIRYWYDNGLHSGDDWNMVIATHLKKAAACLLLLSPNSAESEYVKNELNFAMNHRIPIHTLLMRKFDLPLDIEMMTGRIQMVEMEGDYQLKLVKALPPEVFSNVVELTKDKNDYIHHLFEVEKQLSDRQGTKIYSAKHKKLSYGCVMLEETLQSDEISEIDNRVQLSSKLVHRLFPKVLDYVVVGRRVLVYQEDTGARFLDDYLSSICLSEENIFAWLTNVVEGISSMYRMNLAFRDFARGSMIVTGNDELKIIRAYHPYYGYVKFQEETKRYYFEKELQEIAILLAQLCLGKEPLLPIRIIDNQRFTKHFLLKVNLIIQKCVKENGSAQYRNFDELLEDIKSRSISGKEKAFLKMRAKKLLEYDRAREERSNSFVSSDRAYEHSITYKSLEEQFGFEGTVLLQDAPTETKSLISILMCSTGQVLNFDKREILIGKDTRCDMMWTQPYISRMHLKIIRNEDQSYTVVDLNSTNGTYVVDVEQGTSWQRIPSGEERVVQQGAKIRVGSSEISIL